MSLKSDSSSLYSVAQRIDHIARITAHCGTILGMRVGPTSLIIGHNRVFALVRYILENAYTLDLPIADLETLSQCLRAITTATRQGHIDQAVVIALDTLKLKAAIKLDPDLLAKHVSDVEIEVTQLPCARRILTGEADAGKSTTPTEISEEYKIHGPY